jgi:hypothetical protein
MTHEEWMKEAFSFLSESTKQLITVATGVVTVTVVFSRDISSGARYLALLAWLILLLSVLFGILALYAMSARLAAASGSNQPTINGGYLQLVSRLQVGTFLFGILVMLGFGFMAAAVPETPDKPLKVTLDPPLPAPIVNVYPPAVPQPPTRAPATIPSSGPTPVK